MTRLNDRPLGDVLQDIVGHIQEIVRSEFLLAKAEVKEEAANASAPIATIAVGVLSAVYAGGLFLLAIVFGLSNIMALWLSALVVSIVVAITALGLIHLGKSKLKLVNGPQKQWEPRRGN